MGGKKKKRACLEKQHGRQTENIKINLKEIRWQGMD